MAKKHTEQYAQVIRWLVKQRREKGLKQTDVARILGKPQSYVSKYENRERRLDIVEFIEVIVAIGGDASHQIAHIENAIRTAMDKEKK